MTKVLSQSQIELYREQGFLFPFDGIDPADAADMCRDLDAFERDEGMSAAGLVVKGHLGFRRSWEFARHPRVLDVVEDLIGPNILVLSSRFWIKPGRDGSFVSWHQDSAYFGLEPHELVTVWLALTDSTPENGCMQVIPGSHRGQAYSHVETYDEKNLLARGQTIEAIDDSGAVDLVLKAGQFSCHHERIVHGSPPNATDAKRIGLALFYFPTHVKSTIGRRSADLVRGTDDYGYWDADPAPTADRDERVLAHIREASARYTDPQYVQEAHSPG